MPNGRKASPKQDAVARFLREQIICGDLAPGARLPTRADLEARFGVSSVTVQRALDCLGGHGFVVARGTHGTFVAQRPPHLARHAVVFFNRPHSAGWLRFHDSLLAASAVVATRSGQVLTPFFCSPDASGERAHARLQEALAAQALAGVIFTSHPYPLDGSPVLTIPGIARVALMWGDDYPALGKLAYDQADFLAQACAWFAKRGRRRLALITVPGQFDPPLIDALVARHGLDAPAHWRQTMHPTHAASARACAHLLFHRGQRVRPAALLVSDDNLAEQAIAGLADAGVRVGRDLEVVVHANFPATPPATPSAVQRLGYDACVALASGIELIATQRLGHAPARPTLLRPVFEAPASRDTRGMAAGVSD